MKEKGIEPNNVTWYSFWFYDCIFQAILKKGNPKSLSIVRTHAGDLYEDSTTLNGQILLRDFQFSQMEFCFCISQMGADYLGKTYPKYSDKIYCKRLGTKDLGKLNPLDESAFVVVSCSHVRNVKRVHIIAEALCMIPFPMVWYHFGDTGSANSKDPFIGYFHESVKKLSTNPNVKFVEMGNLEPQKIFEFYASHSINAIISTSSTEGIPVSIMEAISFGIPAIGTNVGGCAEIINDTTGILMDADIDPIQLSEIIQNFKISSKNTQQFRMGVRNFWEANFNEELNYRNTLSTI